MAENSKIGWTHHTWNPWMGCNKVSPACKHCYISSVIKRMGKGRLPFDGPVRTTSVWSNPLRWNRRAEASRTRNRVFTCSLSDFFHEGADDWRQDAWEVIRDCSNLDWLVLTKRPERIADHLPADWADGYPNVWLGTTVERNDYLPRIDLLANVPAAIRFVSAEPLLGALTFGRRIGALDWVITGCEQAHRDIRFPMEDDWVRSIRDECDAAGVPLFHKQYYEGTQLSFDGMIDGVVRQDFPESAS